MPDRKVDRFARSGPRGGELSALSVSALVHLAVVLVAGLFVLPSALERGSGDEIDVTLAESTPFFPDLEPAAPAVELSPSPAEGAPRAVERQIDVSEPNLGSVLAAIEEIREPLEPEFPSVDQLGMRVTGLGGAAGPGGEGSGMNIGAGEGDGEGASFFGVQGGGQSFVYVVDCSGSMGTPTYYAATRMQRVQWELARSISELDESIRFYVLFFSNRTRAMPTDGLVPATDENRRAAVEWIAGIRASGGTEPGLALRRALALEPDVIFLLSDGEFSRAVVHNTRELNRHGVTIHTIGFGAGAGAGVLMPLAQQNGGYYRYVP